MLPMITDLSEYHAAKALVEQQRRHLERLGRELPKSIEIGAMLEVPSLLFQLDELFTVADFVSVGSNDLIQYLNAADRNNKRVASRYDTLSRPVLRALATIAEAASRHRTPLTLCGEIAGRPLEAMALIGLGFHSISMAPANIGPVKAMVLTLDIGRLKARLREMLAAEQGDPRKELLEFAATEGVDLDLPRERPASAASRSRRPTMRQVVVDNCEINATPGQRYF